MHTWAEMPPDPLSVLNACARRAEREGLPPPAAFLGDWLGAAAVIAPSARLAPVAPADAFGTDALVVVDPDTTRTAGSPGTDADPGLTLGFRSYPDVPSGARRLLPEAVSGRADGVLVLGHDGRWTARGTVPDARELAPGPGGGGD
ncbi:MAG: aminodeoxychorismate synthase component I, partial [Dietzia sp.]|nr:aminodeoxychorismate synthase component I [Dietzia sp.]